MKKRVRIVVILLLVAVLGMAGEVKAEQRIYYLAINSSIMDLRYETMPVNINGTMYVYYRDFGAKDSTGAGLGIYVNYSESAAVVQLISGEKELRFDLGAGMTYDQDGTRYSYRALFRKGNVFLPAEATSRFFGLSYGFIVNQYGHEMVRLKNGDAVEDYAFANSSVAVERMEQLYVEYIERQIAAEALEPEAEPEAEPEPEPEPEPVYYGDVRVYMSFFGLSEDSMRDIMETLESVGMRGCFFATAREAAESADLMREIAGRGHEIGLYSERGQTGAYLETSKRMRRYSRIKTILVMANAMLEENVRDQIGSMGFRLWCDGSAMGSYETSEKRIEDTYERLQEASNERVDLVFRADEEVAGALRGVLELLVEGGYDVREVSDSEELG